MRLGTGPKDAAQLNSPDPPPGPTIDHIFISESLIPKTTSQLTYFYIPAHARLPSDHIMVLVTTAASGRRGRLRASKAQYNDAPLRECENHAFTRVLDELADRWLRWFTALQTLPPRTIQLSQARNGDTLQRTENCNLLGCLPDPPDEVGKGKSGRRRHHAYQICKREDQLQEGDVGDFIPKAQNEDRWASDAAPAEGDRRKASGAGQPRPIFELPATKRWVRSSMLELDNP
jgi:hypothetical protein